MTREEIIRNLEYTMEKHKNDIVHTFVTNISVMCKDILDYLKQEPCEDCISRQAVLDQTYLWSKDEFLRITNPFDYLRKRINSLLPVTPKPKTGHWIDADGDNAICGCCNRLNHLYGAYCKHCGAKMVEPQESEDTE